MPAFGRGKVWAFPAPNIATAGATLNTVSVVILGEEEAEEGAVGKDGKHTGSGVPSLQFGVNESYTLNINSSHAVVTAPTQWGAMHGLETFFQLVQLTESTRPLSSVAEAAWDEASFSYGLAERVPLTINDAPFVRWRGLMIDTARYGTILPAFR